ncbi:callose synthase [Achlya hypogyna]|uniref:1,3-beta-glucan synthase n=1 Tax=Achlya hypogyna TaxID=1202772 RepID=A0A1V9YEQ1_ACHHY|nr:callose synthase [Achlya hypogyna]
MASAYGDLELQKELCDEGMALVNAAVEMQNAGDADGAERNFARAVELMERALGLTYATADETEAASRLNNKMSRYIKMIKSQRAKAGTTTKRATGKFNIVEMDALPARYRPIAHLFASSPAYRDLFETMQQTFGFQDGSVANQREHLMLLLANFKEYVDESEVKDAAVAKAAAADAELLTKAIDKFHTKLFDNYKKWCKYVSQKPRFTKEPLADVVLFFLIWGEAGNFRQTPELLCFLFHSLAPSVVGPGTSTQEPGYFLARIIRPLYLEVKKDNDKKTPMGARAPHTDIRNYDDFNEFFWTKKCLKYDSLTIAEAFASTNKAGNPNVVRKTFLERRSWLRALLSFRRIFVSHFVLFIATAAFAMNMALVCPTSPIMYGADLGSTTELFGHFYYKPKPVFASNDDATQEFATGGCNLPKLATCLGVETFNPGVTFQYIPEDFKMLLTDVPFTHCLGLLSGFCTCYLDLLDTCFSQAGTAIMVDTDVTGNRKSKSISYNQNKCMPKWRAAAMGVINNNGNGKLNCNACRLDPSYALSSLTKLSSQFLDFSRTDKGPLIMLAGAGGVALLVVWELQNRLFSGVGIGFVGRSMPVPVAAYCRYVCFWLLLFVVKLVFDYQFIVSSLVQVSIFIWASDPAQYLQVSHFMLQISYHNVIYIAFLWLPAIIVVLYDAQIFYAILSVVFGSARGFSLRIGELRSFRILRITFKSIPKVFNRKIVSNLIEAAATKKKKKLADAELAPPERHFLPVSYDDGSKPLTVKAQAYSSLLDGHDVSDNYTEMSTPHDADASPHAARGTLSDAVAGVTGAEFERTIPFAMAWNRCLASMRDEDVLSHRELSVLSYLIDSKAAAERRLYAPVFLTAGKLDESLDIVTECYAVYDQLKSDKKKDKALQKMETAMTERLLKDDLRIQAILGSYKFSSQIIKLLLGAEHQDLDACFTFIEEAVFQHQTLKALNLSCLYQCRASAAELMKAILDVPTGATDSNIKFQRCLYHVIDTMEVVVANIKKLLAKQEHLVKVLADAPLKPNSFFFPADGQHYASVQLLKIVNDQTAMDIVSRAYQLLTVDNVDAEPRSPEGQRRLRFFANSLFMEMPEARPVRRMHSFSISTPYFNEIVLYSIKELTTENDDSIKLLYYLQTINPHEWENFLERIGCKDMHEALKKFPEEVQLWASYRGQTLARTVRGMMYNEDAIRFLHWLEIGENEPMHLKACTCNACIALNEMVALKFSYVCTCQIYGRQKDEQRQQAADIDFLLMKHPGLRVAYVDGPKKMKDGPPKYFSCLVRAQGDKIVEVYRVELPGDPIIGEGKPENQNHAIIFTRGEWLQCIDMNQDGYLEECLKMPNLLATVDRKDHAKNPLTIIGFREYVFTGGVSNLASFMQIQELSFVSLGQRMLALFHVRQHYGHPDIFDKMFAMTTGGTAKSSRSINLSEDIFAGFNTTLRGGHVSHEEFIQVGKGRDVGMQQLALFEAKLSSGAGECVISRDAMRMANRLDYFRLNSWFYGNLGWYFTQTMTVFGVYFFIYGKIYFCLSGLDAFYLQTGGMGISGVLNTSWALQFGFLLVVPVIAVIGVEQGFRHGISYLLWNCMTLGPIFFTFQMGNRMNYFDRTLIHGGAKYRATGRGFTIKHEKFAELFRFYAFSHFYRGVELVFLLILFYAYGTFSWCNCSWRVDQQFYNNIEPLPYEWNVRCYANWYQTCVLPTNQNYGIMSFSLWIIAATWMWAPFFFNPSGLDWDKVIDDYNDWQNWLQTKNDSSESWFGWWTTELEYLEHSTPSARFVQMIRKTRFLLVAIGLYLQMMYRIFYKDKNKVVSTNKADGTLVYYQPFIIVGALFVLMLLLVCCGYCASRFTKKSQMKQKKLRKIKFNLSFFVLIVVLFSFLYLSLTEVIEICLIVAIATYWFVQVMIVRLKSGHIVVHALGKFYDRAVGWIVFGPILFVAMFMPFVSSFQQRVMFNSAFTSGLEVSKLFANDAVPTQTLKGKRTKKKKRDD